MCLHSKEEEKELPRLIPPRRRRPAYPSLATILFQFVNHFLVRQCLAGALLVHWLGPWYEKSRLLAQDHQISKALYFTIVVSMVHTGLYITINLPYFVCDVLKIGQSAKLYRKPYMEPTPELLRRLGMDQVVSHLIVGPMTAYLLFPLVVEKKTWLQDLDAPVPTSIWDTTRIILVFCLLNELLFYTFHRCLHSSSFLYQRIHKKHHEFRGSVGYAAEYSHGLENLVSNQFPVLAGIVVVECHPLTFFVWIAIRLQETYDGHSGYASFPMPARRSAANSHRNRNHSTKICSHQSLFHFLSRTYMTCHHDYHHTHNKGNFGSFWVDWIFGTMDHYQSIGGFQGYLDLKLQETSDPNKTS